MYTYTCRSQHIIRVPIIFWVDHGSLSSPWWWDSSYKAVHRKVLVSRREGHLWPQWTVACSFKMLEFEVQKKKTPQISGFWTCHIRLLCLQNEKNVIAKQSNWTIMKMGTRTLLVLTYCEKPCWGKHISVKKEGKLWTIRSLKKIQRKVSNKYRDSIMYSTVPLQTLKAETTMWLYLEIIISWR